MLTLTWWQALGFALVCFWFGMMAASGVSGLGQEYGAQRAACSGIYDASGAISSRCYLREHDRAFKGSGL